MHQSRPDLPDALIASVTETLARWLPSGDAVLAPRGWGRDEWLAAEGIVYWHKPLPWLHDRAAHSGLPIPESLALLAALSRERTQRMLDAAAELIAALQGEWI